MREGASRDPKPHRGAASAAYADAHGAQRATIVKRTLRFAGAAAALVGLALAVLGGVLLAGPQADADAVFAALDAIAVGLAGALIGAGLIVYARRAP